MTERAEGVVADADDATLLAIESIKQLKARYCRNLDSKDWAAWRTVFTDDFVSDTAEAGGKVIEGADDFVAFTRKALGRPTQATAHQVHAPEIALTSATTARGVWALQDVVRFGPGVTLVGYGHYHETYEKIGGLWLIKSSKLTRLREDIVTPVFSLYVSDRIRRAIGRVANRLIGR
ncbi:nuclear transport factor 2 family protein [Mycobacterium paraffinicum]|uniref:SnoaL-like domain-containing protein n=1 Tax=Mycobacterium paraffinicum TaxID=53378 RepID=A0ABP8RE18_9MYCO|nr:nuclear transport factor 2 family protein [Mycobacterium paraffinicum]MCV7313849.1 nuclear transport factor 2 family protein [Mycobacterium paraffinicum]